MPDRNIRRILYFFLLMLLVTAVLFRENTFHFLIKTSESVGTAGITHGIRLLRISTFTNTSDFRCVSAKVANLSFPMCLYTAGEDIYVSKAVLDGGYFEGSLVAKFVQLFRHNQDVTFLDLGANIGTYSLPAAHSGIKVLSVEPNWNTARRLATSSHLGGLEDRIGILNYAVSNIEATTYLATDPQNRGDTYMARNCSEKNCTLVSVTILNKLTPLIRTKRAIMKVDVQEAEIKIFTVSGAGKFFKKVDVPIILMEWVLFPARYGASENSRRMIDRFLEFFYQRDYEVFDPRSEKKLNVDWLLWPIDVLFKKSDLPQDHVFRI